MPWHIYIEGDGRPWESRYKVSPDPTIAKPLMLRLMQKESASVIYLGRPCYLGLAGEAACEPYVWTHGRYSEQVVSSMADALRSQVKQHDIKRLVLFGHSGGGTLAMLLAERIPQTQAVVTLAGNLDTQAWVRKHGYSPLVGSLNPADLPELSSRIDQFHFVGKMDNNLPGNTSAAFLKSTILLKGVGHTQDWERVYCDILKRVGGYCRRDQ